VSETKYQTELIKKLKKMFPGCEIIRGDSGYQQGLPDLFILYGSYWASLEVKLGPKVNVQPNQDYYIQKFDNMSFGAYIYPENEEEVLGALQQAFKSPRGACVS